MLMLTLVGCSKTPGPEFAPVTGRVTFGGQPLAAGMIHFVPDESQGTSGPMSTGGMQADGSFSLRGPGRHVGAIVGNHRVYLTMPVSDFTPTPVVIDGEVVVQAPKPGESSDPTAQVPKRYLQADTSGWTASVVAGGANIYEFEIKK